jgi:hypothetical protein
VHRTHLGKLAPHVGDDRDRRVVGLVVHDQHFERARRRACRRHDRRPRGFALAVDRHDDGEEHDG